MVYDNDSSHVERLTLSDAYGQEVACLTLDHLLFFYPSTVKIIIIIITPICNYFNPRVCLVSNMKARFAEVKQLET
jgi:hypothetical protein